MSFERALQHWDAGRLDEAATLLAEEAGRGHADALARLGRLGCLEATPPDGPAGAAEEQLRRAVAARPDDAQSATLLASLLVRWANAAVEGQNSAYEPELWEWYRWPDSVEDGYWTDEDHWLDWEDSALQRRVVSAYDEAEALLTGVLTADPEHVPAATTLAELWYGRWMAYNIVKSSDIVESSSLEADRVERMMHALVTDGVPVITRAARLAAGTAVGDWCRRTAADIAAVEQRHEPPDGPDARRHVHSWYLLERWVMVSNNGDLGVEQLLTADAAELRWAADRWLSRGSRRHPMDRSKGEQLTLTVCDGELTTLDLVDGVDWATIDLPALSGTPLPCGLPTLSPTLDHPVNYGFTA